MPHRSRLLRVILIGLLTGPVWGAHITDKLVVGLYPTPKVEGQPSMLLSSGTPLDVLSRKRGFVEVRLTDDKTGWVEADYVTDEKPARAMLLETQARLRQMGLELAKLRGESAADAASSDQGLAAAAGDTDALAQAQQRIADLQSALAARPESDDARRRLDRLNAQVREALEVLAETQGLTLQGTVADGAPMAFIDRYQTVIIGIAALVLGFGCGVAFIDYRIRRRYGGFRI